MSSRCLLGVLLLTACGESWHGAEVVDDRPKDPLAGSDPFPAAAMAGEHPLVVWGAVITDGFMGGTSRTWARLHDGTSWRDFADLGARTQQPALVASTNGTAIALVHDGVTRFDGGSWSPPASVDFGVEPQLAMDGSGNALVLGKRDHQLFVTAFAPSSGWSSPLALADDVSGYRIAMSGAGAAIAVWSDGIDIRSRQRDTAGVWSTVHTVDTGCAPRAVRMFGANSSVVLASCGSSLRLLRSAPKGFLPAGEIANGTWTDLAVNAAGAALVAATDREVLSLAHAPAGLSLSAPMIVTSHLISPAVGSTFGITLADADAGHIVFSELVDHKNRIKGREFSAAGGLEAPFEISAVGSAYYPSLAGTADGHAIVAWNQGGLSPPEQIRADLFY